jgi:large subunit ribosomal protein L29
MSKKSTQKKDQDISGITTEKLSEKLLTSKKELFNLRCQKVMGEVTDTSRFKKVRREVARVKTELAKRSGSENNA